MTKKKNIGMLVLDILMVLVFAILFNKSAFGTLAFHEIAGLCFAGAFVAHIVLNRKWIAGVGKNFGSMPTKTKIEFILMWVLLADLAVMTVTGILISKVVFAKLLTAQFNLEWLHKATAYLALLLMGLHIGLAWNKVLGMCRNIFHITKKSGTADAVLRVVAVVIFAFGVYSMATTSYFTRAFAFNGGGSSEHQMMPDGGGFGGPQGQNGQSEQNGQTDQSGQTDQNSQSTQSGQSTQTAPDSQTTQNGDSSQSETTSGSAVTTASTLSYTQLDSSASDTTQQGDSTGDTSLAGGGKSGGKMGGGPGMGGQNGQKPSGGNGQMPSGGNGQVPADGQAPADGDGQMPSGDGQMPTDGGSGQMNGEHGGSGSTAQTAAANLSILGAFAVLAYYLEKLLGSQKKKKAPAVNVQPEPETAAADTETAAESETTAADIETAAGTDDGADAGDGADVTETADNGTQEASESGAPEVSADTAAAGPSDAESGATEEK